MEVAHGDRVRPHVHEDTRAGYIEAHCGPVAGGDGVIAREGEQVDGFLGGHGHVEGGEERASRRHRECGQRAGEHEQPQLLDQRRTASTAALVITAACNVNRYHGRRVSWMRRGDYIVKHRVACRVGSHDHSEVVERCHPNSAAIIFATPAGAPSLVVWRR